MNASIRPWRTSCLYLQFLASSVIEFIADSKHDLIRCSYRVNTSSHQALIRTNCEDNGLKCRGPRKGVLFINENRRAGQLAVKSRPRIATRAHAQVIESYGRINYSKTLQSSKQTAHTYLCFLRRYWDRSVGHSLQSYDHSNWIEICAACPADYPVTSLALQALSATFFGRRHRQAEVDNHAFQLHG